MVKVSEIFESISGEAGYFPQGSVCTFIRFQGCNLKCKWCDTPATQGSSGGQWWQVPYLVEHCQLYSTKRVLITGGEPLHQREGLIELIKGLCEKGFHIQVETNGSYAIPLLLDPLTHWIVDVKPPSSGYWKGTDTEFLNNLGGDWNNIHLKFVVENRQDILFAIKQMKKRWLPPADFIVSPVGGNREWYPEVIEIFKLTAPELLPRIIFSLQIHKIVKMA